MLTRYEWRHNSILHYISTILRDTKNEKFKVFADLDGFKVNGTTIPANIIATTKRPDLVVIETTERKEHVKLFELTVPFEQNIEQAMLRKVERYDSLQREIRDSG